MTMLPGAARPHRGHRGRRSDQFAQSFSFYAASAMALVRAKGKVNALPVLALVCLLWIFEVRAPRLAVYDLFAPSKPFIPLLHFY